MSLSSNAIHAENPLSVFRRASSGNDASVLTDIYQEDVNIAVWQNKLSSELLTDINKIMLETDRLNVRITASPNGIAEKLADFNDELTNKKALCEHIELLADMFCTLFELKKVGLRLAILDQAMCPKFHVDRVPCRLVTTFSGLATEWLSHDKVDRSKLGKGSMGIPDETSGIMQSQSDIQHMSSGDVILLKGEGWYNNEYCGAVHRSPAIPANERRLLLTLDFID